MRPGAEIVQLVAVVIGSDLKPVGAIDKSSALANQLVSNIEWSQLGNFFGIPTDRIQRDERLGWTAGPQIFTPTAALTADIYPFITRWLDNLGAAQDASGRVPDASQHR